MKVIHSISLPILILILLLNACKSREDIKYQRGVIATEAMVVSVDELASQVGYDVLKKGGNAVDAMVAVHFALAVVYPYAGNIGGGGFMVMRTHEGQVHTLDFREMAPSEADKDMYLDENGEVIKDLSTRGHLAAGVPGSVAGMTAAHDSLGSLPWAELVQPAVELAKKGHAFSEKEVKELNKKLGAIAQYSTQPNEFTQKTTWAAGDSISYPDLARTLSLIRDQGAAGFYEGETAEKIIAEMEAGNGIMNLLDLANYQARWRPPITGTYKNYDIISMAPPSSGGIALLQLLQMVSAYPLEDYGWQSPEATHVMVEAERRVYADRSKHLGDSDYYNVPMDSLLDPAYNLARMADFNPERASLSKEISAGNFQLFESDQTTHYSIVDAQGNAVSVTTTLNGGFGSCVVVGGAGFFLNNEMDDFSAKPGHANIYGLIGAAANAIEPGKRMLSSMTPTIIEKDDELFMVLGSPGGSTIITSVFQAFLNVVEYDMSMQGAVSVPRFHHQWLPDSIRYEKGAVGGDTRSVLQAMGHRFDGKPVPVKGCVNAILVLSNGKLEGGADPRRDGVAMGF